MLLAGDIQRYRARTSSDQHVSSLKLHAFDGNHILTGEAGKPVKSVDAVFDEIPFPIAGYGIGEAAFKHHQVAPIDPRLARDAVPAHACLRVDRLSTADQHLLRIAAAESASPAERTVIDQCYRPPCGTHSRACHLRGSARADDHEIVGLHDAISSEGSQKGGREWPPKCQEFHEEAHRHHGTFSGVRPVSSVAFGGCCAYTGGAGRDCTSNALHGSRGTIIRKSTEVCTLLSVY